MLCEDDKNKKPTKIKDNTDQTQKQQEQITATDKRTTANITYTCVQCPDGVGKQGQ